jgi:DNA-binding MarR family transcriptional regulator
MQAGELYTKELNKKYQISSPQLNCLLALHENGALPPSRIAKKILVNSSTVTGVIDRLEEKGLVQRVRNSPDRRVINIQLTDAGRTLALHAPPPMQQKIVDGLNKLSKSELERILHGLAVLTQLLDVEDVEVG